MVSRYFVRRATSLYIVALGGLAGCGIFPADVRMPTRQQQQSEADPSWHPFLGPASSAVSKEEMDRQFDAYIGTWRLQEHSLMLETDGLDTFQFAALVWSAYKTATGRLHDAKWGAAGAAGVSILGSNFKIFNQALNYRVGAEAMQCVKRKVDVFPSSFWNAFYAADGTLAFTDAEVLDYVQTGTTDDAKDNLAKSILALRGNHQAINIAVTDISNRVIHNLESTRVNMPSAADITNAVNQATQGTKNAVSVADAAASAAQTKAGNPSPAATLAASPFNLAKAAHAEQFTQLRSAAAADKAANESQAAETAAPSPPASAATTRLQSETERQQRAAADARAHANAADEAFSRALNDLQAHVPPRAALKTRIDDMVAAHRAAVASAKTSTDGLPAAADSIRYLVTAQAVETTLASSLSLPATIAIQSKDLMTKATSLATDLGTCVALIPDNSP